MKYSVCFPSGVVIFLSGLSAVFQIQADMPDAVEKKDHSLSLTLRNYYQDRQLRDYSSQYIETLPDGAQRNVKTHAKQKAWGQGLGINFESASWGNDKAGVGIDFSFYGGLKLTGESDRYGTTVLKQDEPYFDAAEQHYLAKQSSYAKLGLANIRGYIDGGPCHLDAKGGWIPIEKPLLQTYYRLTPTTFQGGIAELTVSDFNLYGAWADRVSMYNWDKMEKFTSNKSGREGRHNKHEAIDYIYTVGAAYDVPEGAGGDLAYAESESYLKLYYARLKYNFVFTDENALLLDGRFYQGNENGAKWKSNNIVYGGFDKDGSLYNMNARLQLDMLTLSASYTQTKAEKKGTLGFFDGHLAYDAGNDYDDFDYWTKRQLSDFNHNGEQSWQAGIKYAFDKMDMPGLSLGYTYTEGRNIEVSGRPDFADKYKESEHNIELGYAFQQPELKGLRLTILYATNKADKAVSLIKNEDKKGLVYEGMSDIRIYVDYMVKAF